MKLLSAGIVAAMLIGLAGCGEGATEEDQAKMQRREPPANPVAAPGSEMGGPEATEAAGETPTPPGG